MAAQQQRVAVIGQGIIGLTSAAQLTQAGFTVDVFSRADNAIASTSMAAGAYWWPHKASPQAKISQWAKAAYAKYTQYKTMPESGVHFEQHFRFCLDPDDNAYARHLTNEWYAIDGADYGIPCHEAYLVILPVIDVPVYLPYLKQQLKRQGIQFFQRELTSPAELFPDYALVVNCTGVWAGTFVNDTAVFPIRGQTVRVSLPANLRASSRLHQRDDKFTLVLPRTTDVILGGTAQVGSWDCTPNSEETALMLQRCSQLVPQIAESQLLETKVGLRPGRSEVRLELELLAPQQPVIHNYGHGGSGYTVAWGCAQDVVQLAEQYFAGLRSHATA